MNHLQRAARLKELHYRPGIFVVANGWDGGSARLLENMGFEAIATTSAGMAFGLGKPDLAGPGWREDVLKNAQQILEATSLPVTADLLNGFGDQPEDCAVTIKLAASMGLSGASIEDSTGRAADPVYAFRLAVERIKASVGAVSALNRPFILTARCENFLCGRPDLNDTIQRLTAYAEAGADVLFAPGLQRLEDIAAVVSAVRPKAVNVLVDPQQSAYSIQELEAVGVKRISLGSGLFRTGYNAMQHSARPFLPADRQAAFKAVQTYHDFNALFEGWQKGI